MIVEKLDADSYPILKGIADGFCPDPANSVAIVVRDGADYVGRVLLVAVAHVEGTWVREDHRGGSVGARLLHRIEEEARAQKLKTVFAYSKPEHDHYMDRLGYTREPWSVWRKDL